MRATAWVRRPSLCSDSSTYDTISMCAELGCHDDDRPPTGTDHVGTASAGRGETRRAGDSNQDGGRKPTGNTHSLRQQTSASFTRRVRSTEQGAEGGAGTAAAGQSQGVGEQAEAVVPRHP